MATIRTDENFPYSNRDLSWLAFNYRVLQEAKDPSVPLFERIKFLAIYSSNLDEFFRVRVASIKSLIRLGKRTKKAIDFPPEEVLDRINETVRQQQLEFTEIYQKHILPLLAAINIHLVKEADLKKTQTDFLDKYIEEKLIPYLQPMLIVKHKIRTFLINNALYLGVELGTKGRTPRYAVVRIPSHRFPRFLVLPSEQENERLIIMLDDIVRYALPRIFPGYSIENSYSFKMTRDAEMYLEDEYSGDLIEKIRKGLNKRNIGASTRFVYDRNMPANLLRFLMQAFSVKSSDLQPEGRYHNNFDLFQFPNFGLQHLQDEPLPPLKHPTLSKAQVLFDCISEGDHLVHYPYQRYNYVIKLLEQAAYDPDVKRIRILQYRVAKDSQIIAALRSAIAEGKEVMVFVEVKARFDEEANLDWAEKLEKWGAIVKYSLPELKVHSKILSISREEKGKLQDYCYLSTGNFHEGTARLYEDYGFFTKDKRLTKEVDKVLNYLEHGELPKKPFKHLLVGQFRMRKNIYAMIDREIELAQAGQEARITVKLNSLQDHRMIRRLYEASEAGVKIDLIVRGIFGLQTGIEGYSKNIRAISIVDRFLEHSRIYHFHNAGEDKIYLSSADWMTRNLYYRIECAFPIYDKGLQEEIKDFLNLQLKDNVKARILDPKLSNHYKIDEGQRPFRSQLEVYAYYKKQLEASQHAKK
ncbi:polyphosphate kinase 1 [Saprospira grandis]|uniref:Polyphosphate kinase n=1 Tax=Saprospira grandis (strain Lewin) TaxID=984262 RepID=H6L183_SAPGL|nr:polyphosphate kinase 1 [Saprospira grandis]AFC26119.1 polyphosphate kinase [Saprospira grandis str. Lewin]